MPNPPNHTAPFLGDDLPIRRAVPVGILSRVSPHLQVEKVSLDQQEDLCRSDLIVQVSALEGGAQVEVVATYRDAGVSGDGRNRDELTKALSDVKAGRIRYLLVYDVDRLSREPAQNGQALRACVDAKARLLFVKHRMTYTASRELEASDEILYYLKSCMAKQERQQIMERTARGRRGLVEKGIQAGRAAPRYGYVVYQS